MENLILLLVKNRQKVKEDRIKTLINLIHRNVIKKQNSQLRQAFDIMLDWNHQYQHQQQVSFTLEQLPKSSDQNSNKEIKDALYQLQNFNLVQQEIIKKEKVCQMIYILQSKLRKQYLFGLYKIQSKWDKRIFQIKNIAYSLKLQQRLLGIMQLFEKSRKMKIKYEMKKAETISFIWQRQLLKRQQSFLQWYNIVKSESILSQQQYYYEQQVTQTKDYVQIGIQQIQLATNLYVILNRFILSRYSNSFIILCNQKVQKKLNDKTKIQILFILLKKLFYKESSKCFNKLLQKQEQNQLKGHLIKNLSIVGGKLNQMMNIAIYKQHKKRRQLILIKLLRQQEQFEQERIQQSFCKWKKQLQKYNLLIRLELMNQNKQLEEDQKQLVQQYKQIQNQNQELQVMFQQVQTYYNTPTGQSMKKSDLQKQEEEEQEEDYSYQFVENMENVNMELKQKIEQQEQQIQILQQQLNKQIKSV